MVFLDFDDTLFSQQLFYKWLDEYLQRHDVPLGRFKDTADGFHEVKGRNIRLYDHRGHFKELTGREWAFLSAEMEEAILERETDFCFSDTHDFLDKLVAEGYAPRLLTYGDPAFQYFKINTCTRLKKLNLPKHIVLEPKAQFLAREYGQGSGVLIDDKGPLDLPANWTHLWLRRHEDGAARRVGNEVYFHRLEQFDDTITKT